MTFQKAIQERFPLSNPTILSSQEHFDIIRFEVTYLQKKYFVICTSGLWSYEMPVTPKYEQKKHNELCFCLPGDWDFEEENNQWVVEKLITLTNFVLDKQTWFGAGHTIPNGNPAQPLSKAFTQDHFFFDDATFLSKIFNPFHIEDKLVNFLFIIPITKDELNYKLKKNTFKFKRKLAARNIHEVLEDFRPSFVTKKWILW